MNKEYGEKETSTKQKIISIIMPIAAFLIICLACAVIFKTIDFKYADHIEELSEIFDKMSSFFSVMIGVYIAILVFMATARTPISGILHSKRLIRKFSITIFLSIIYGLAFILLDALLIYQCELGTIVMCSVAIVELFYMIYFVAIVFMIFNYNMKELEREAIKQNQKTENFITLIENIEKNTRK